MSVLGVTITDLSRLSKHEYVNKWSRYKPVKHSSVSRLTNAQLSSIKFGLTPQTNNKLVAVSRKYNTTNNNKLTDSGYAYADILAANKEWEYVKPTGGEASPYRMSDFIETSDGTMGFGYCHDTPPPIGNFKTWNLKLSEIATIADDTNVKASYGSKNSDPRNYTCNISYNGGGGLYSSFTMKYGNGTWANIQGANTYSIPVVDLLGSQIESEFWRIGLALFIPNQQYADIIVGRYTFYEANGKTATELPPIILPSLCTNQYMCDLIRNYAKSIVNKAGGTSITNPTFTIKALFFIAKDVVISTKTRNGSQTPFTATEFVATTNLYSPPANSSSIDIIITDNVNYDLNAAEAYKYISVSAVDTGNYTGSASSPSYMRRPIRELRVEQIAGVTSTKRIQVDVTFTYINGYNGTTPITATRTMSQIVELTSNNESSFYSSAWATYPELVITSSVLTIK